MQLAARSSRPHQSPFLFYCLHSIGLLLGHSGSTGSQSPSAYPPTLQVDAELQALLHALPTKVDIESLIGRLEKQHRKDLIEVKRDMQSLSTRLTSEESSLASLETHVASLESLQEAHVDAAVTLQLHLEDMEDRSWCNNLRLQGPPEVTGPKDLVEIELDQIHRALGPRPTDPK